MSENREQQIEKATDRLSEREAHAYKIWCSSNKPGIAPTYNAKLFNLFLQGKNCEEIRRLNQQLQLGEIVAARIEGEWDRRKSEHLDQLLNEATKRVQQATFETADFVCDMLAVANKEHGDQLRRYLQSGDKADLGDFRIQNLGNLKATIEILQKLTGQDKQQKLTVAGELLHRHESAKAEKVTSEQAGKVLKLLTAVK